MTPFQKAIIAIGVAALLLLALLGRYEVVIGSRGDGSPPAYLLDRWTGKTEVMFGINRRGTVVPEATQ